LAIKKINFFQKKKTDPGKEDENPEAEAGERKCDYAMGQKWLM